jgi:hypothetical protein
MRPHGRAKIGQRRPEHTALCQRCGTLYNRSDLSAQFQYAGTGLIDTGFKVCPRCLDVPNQNERTLILPPDPSPILDALPDAFPMDMVSSWTLQGPPGVPMIRTWSSFSVTLSP